LFDELEESSKRSRFFVTSSSLYGHGSDDEISAVLGLAWRPDIFWIRGTTAVHSEHFSISMLLKSERG
jgi:hypothetical protein